MRVLHPILAREINQLESTHVVTWAFEITITGAPLPYRIVNYDQTIVFHGLNFLPFGLAVDSLEETTAGSLTQIRVTMDNVPQEMQSLLENYWAPVPDPYWEVKIWSIDATQPDLTPFSSAEVYTVMSVPTDLVTAVPDLIVEGLTLSRVVPRRRFTTSSGFYYIPRR